jgi:hypothetical protein
MVPGQCQGDREGRPYHTETGVLAASQTCMVRATLAVALALCRNRMSHTLIGLYRLPHVPVFVILGASTQHTQHISEVLW